MFKRWKAFVLALTISLISTSAVQAQITPKIDSPPQEQKIELQTKGAPVNLSGEELFLIQARIGSFPPEERAQAIGNRLESVAQDLSIPISDIKVDSQDQMTSIIAGQKLIITITPADARLKDKSEQQLAKDYVEIIKEAVKRYRESRSPKELLIDLVYAAISTLVVFVIFFILNLAFKKFFELIKSWRENGNLSLRFSNYELINSQRIADILVGLTKFIRLAIYLSVVYLYITLVLSLFPWTRPYGKKFFELLSSAIVSTIEVTASYIPNIFFIVLIVAATYYIISFTKFIFDELERGNISIPGFYAEWIQPTYKLVLFLIVALSAAIAIPYFPGYNSQGFQGISIFFGLLISLGSSSFVANIISGIILIYTRSFQIGDRIKIAEVVGDVVEKTLLVTRIKTIKNVIITVPNAMVLNSYITNYTSLAKDPTSRLILNTTITLGYDVPWRKVHEVLINAALATENISKEFKPFVLQTSLDDFYVSYEINAYTSEAAMMAKIYSELHQNIQDKCNEADIEILSPHYSALRDGNQTTIPGQYLPKGYTPPLFKIASLGNQFGKFNGQEGDKS